MNQMSNRALIPAWIGGALQPVEKLEAHQRGLRHKAVSVFLMEGDFLLLQRRAMGKYHTPGLWANSCCTHPHWGESPDDCARRRLMEELGVAGVTLHHAERVEYRADVGGGLIEHEVVDLYIGEAPEGIEIHPDPEEVMDWEWIDVEDLADEISEDPSRFTPWLRIYMERHRNAIFGPRVEAAE